VLTPLAICVFTLFFDVPWLRDGMLVFALVTLIAQGASSASAESRFQPRAAGGAQSFGYGVFRGVQGLPDLEGSWPERLIRTASRR